MKKTGTNPITEKDTIKWNFISCLIVFPLLMVFNYWDEIKGFFTGLFEKIKGRDK